MTRLRFWKSHERSTSLRTRLAFVLALALALPAALGIAQGYHNHREQQANDERTLRQSAGLVAAAYQSLTVNARNVLTTLAAQPDVRNLSMPGCRAALGNALALLADYDLILAADPDGVVRCASHDVDPDIAVRGSSWFQAAVEGGEFGVRTYEAGPLLPHGTLVGAIPMYNAARQMNGVLAIFINLTTLEKLSDPLEDTGEARLAILDAQGETLPFRNTVPKIPPGVRETVLAAAARQDMAVHRVRDSKDRESLFAAAALPLTGLSAVLVWPSQPARGWIGLKLLADLASPLLIWLVAVATAGIVIHRLVIRWVLQLRAMVSRFLHGGHVAQAPRFDDAPQELQDLAGSFVKMMQTIEARNAELNKAIAHRDVLIKEIHHRVKNNLQIISSLLNLQSRSLHDDAARDALLGLQSRINALALIHQSLYETQEQQMVELQGFLGALCSQLEALVSGRQIYVIAVVPRYFVSAETAVTLAMLVTETVTNATKHAFTGRKSGRVLVELQMTDDGRATLTISDNGSGGFARHESREEPRGLGRDLIQGYVRQLHGVMSVIERDGTHVEIKFERLE